MIILLYTFHPIKVTRSYSMEIQSTSHHRTAEASLSLHHPIPKATTKTRYSAHSLGLNKQQKFPEKVHPDMCQILHFPHLPSHHQPPTAQPQKEKKGVKPRQTDMDQKACEPRPPENGAGIPIAIQARPKRREKKAQERPIASFAHPSPNFPAQKLYS